MASKADEFRIYTLHSQKGGVGKTSLAIAISAMESIHRTEDEVLLLDADLTGTCISDALEKKHGDAEKQIWRDKGYLNCILDANPDETLRLFQAGRRVSVPKECIEHWNDKYIVKHHKYILSKIQFHFIQSNPRYDVVREILPSLAQETLFSVYSERLTEIVALAYGLGYRCVVIDLPPGLSGLSEAALHMLDRKNFAWELRRYGFKGEEKDISVCPIAVSTCDKADYFSLFPGTWNLMRIVNEDRSKEEELEFNIWINKIEPEEKRQGAVIDPPHDLAEMFDELENIQNYKNRFKENYVGESEKNDLDLYLKFLQRKRTEAEKSGGPAFPYVPFFSIADICLVISNIYNKWNQPEDFAVGMERWVRDVAKVLGIDIEPEGKKGTSNAKV